VPDCIFPVEATCTTEIPFRTYIPLVLGSTVDLQPSAVRLHWKFPGVEESHLIKIHSLVLRKPSSKGPFAQIKNDSNIKSLAVHFEIVL
jgi:hypothetical protein